MIGKANNKSKIKEKKLKKKNNNKSIIHFNHFTGPGFTNVI